MVVGRAPIIVELRDELIEQIVDGYRKHPQTADQGSLCVDRLRREAWAELDW